MNLPSGGDLVTGSVMNSELSDMIRKEEIGGFFNVKGIKKIYDLQRLAVEETRLKIPLIVGVDIIHGYETIFPIPLALSCSWDTLAIQRMAQISVIGARADVLFGKAVPCSKLTTTFPRSVGQLPLFYNHLNTGRPDPDHRVFNRYTSNYLDESNKPLYTFGYGLSYTDFAYDDLQLSSETLPKNGNLTAFVTVTNKGNHDGYETVQIYLRDIYAEVARPVKELKSFDRISLKRGESREVKFVLTEDA